jgi:hypothetical protein
VVVDGRVLMGAELESGARLPARVGPYPAVSPACNDTGGDEKDQRTTVNRLAGIPPRVAVAGRDGSTLYSADGSLLQLATHPLHAARFSSRHEPSYRERRRCRPHRTPLRATVLYAGDALRVRLARRTVLVGVDSSSRITNRPAYEPVLPRQRLRLRTSRCGPRRVADRITFVGPSVTPEPYGTASVAGRSDDAWAIVPILLVASAAGMIAYLARRLRDVNARPSRP